MRNISIRILSQFLFLKLSFSVLNYKFSIGASLVVNSSWENPSGEWRVGYKLVYELFTGTLTSRLKVSIACYDPLGELYNCTLLSQALLKLHALFNLIERKKEKVG